MTRRQFAEINRDRTLTDEDKKRLKAFNWKTSSPRGSARSFKNTSAATLPSS